MDIKPETPETPEIPTDAELEEIGVMDTPDDPELALSSEGGGDNCFGECTHSQAYCETTASGDPFKWCPDCNSEV